MSALGGKRTLGTQPDTEGAPPLSRSFTARALRAPPVAVVAGVAGVVAAAAERQPAVVAAEAVAAVAVEPRGRPAAGRT
jgi:hypothetical protein